MEERIQALEREVQVIKERNQRVETNKAWEVSKFRIFSIAITTYIIVAFVLYVIDAKNYLTGALIPAIGYFLSTQSLPTNKKWWIKNHEK